MTTASTRHGRGGYGNDAHREKEGAGQRRELWTARGGIHAFQDAHGPRPLRVAYADLGTGHLQERACVWEAALQGWRNMLKGSRAHGSYMSLTFGHSNRCTYISSDLLQCSIVISFQTCPRQTLSSPLDLQRNVSARILVRAHAGASAKVKVCRTVIAAQDKSG